MATRHQFVYLVLCALKCCINAQNSNELLFYSNAFDNKLDWSINCGDDPVVWKADCAQIQSTTTCANIQGGCLISKSISLFGYHDIRLLIDIKAMDLNNDNEKCFIQYRTSSTEWTKKDLAGPSDGVYNDMEAIISNSYDDQSSFELAMGNSGGGGDDNCYFGNLRVFGVPYTNNPTNYPTTDPSTQTIEPTKDSTTVPTIDPTTDPTTIDPTTDSTIDPTTNPTTNPTTDPTTDPTTAPTTAPTIDPTTKATTDITSTTEDQTNKNAPTQFTINIYIPSIIPTLSPTFLSTTMHTYSDDNQVITRSNSDLTTIVISAIISAFCLCVCCLFGCKVCRSYPRIKADNSIKVYIEPSSHNNVLNDLVENYISEAVPAIVMVDDNDCSEQNSNKDIPEQRKSLDDIIDIKHDDAHLMTVRSWLELEVELPMYYEHFVENGYENFEFIKDIKLESHLEEIGISSKDHRIQILKAIDIVRFNKKRKETSNVQKAGNDRPSVYSEVEGEVVPAADAIIIIGDRTSLSSDNNITIGDASGFNVENQNKEVEILFEHKKIHDIGTKTRTKFTKTMNESEVELVDDEYIDVDKMMKQRKITKGALSAKSDMIFKENVDNSVAVEKMMFADIVDDMRIEEIVGDAEVTHGFVDNIDINSM